jgi:hypothetical protein
MGATNYMLVLPLLGAHIQLSSKPEFAASFLHSMCLFRQPGGNCSEIILEKEEWEAYEKVI